MQFEFRKGKNTDDALEFVKNYVNDNMSNNLITCLMSLDMQNAFNTINMDDLECLLNLYNIPDKIIFIFYI